MNLTTFNSQRSNHPSRGELVSWLVNWCFGPSQPLGTTSGLKETFTKRHIVEKTNKAEIRLEEQSEKTESCRVTDTFFVQTWFGSTMSQTGFVTSNVCMKNVSVTRNCRHNKGLERQRSNLRQKSPTVKVAENERCTICN